MKSKVKRTAASILCALLLLSAALVIPAYALTNISGTTTGISISGGTASAICSVTGYQGIATKCTIKANLQQLKSGNWTTIATWEQSFASYRGSLTEGKAVTKGYDYRVQAIYTATSSSGTETLTVYSGVKTY